MKSCLFPLLLGVSSILMAKEPKILKIAQIGRECLYLPSEEVDPKDPEVAEIVKDMFSTIYDFISPIAGLAAPQVHINKRIVIYQVPKERVEEDDFESIPYTVMLNPSWAPLSDEKVYGYEACLSSQYLVSEVPRYQHIQYTYQDMEGNFITKEAKGFHARVIQHECDHLDGIVTLMRVEDRRKIAHLEEPRSSHIKEWNY